MNCFEKVTVNAQAINWLKEKYPELCIKAGLCERIGGRLYTKTFIDPPAAQPEQQAEPVAWLKEDWTGGHLNYESVYEGAFAAFPVYKHPPAAQRPWVGLTHQQTKDCVQGWDGNDAYVLCRAIEAKLKDRNT